MIHVLRGGWVGEGSQIVGLFSSAENAVEFQDKFFVNEEREGWNEVLWWCKDSELNVPMWGFMEIVEFPLNPTEY